MANKKIIVPVTYDVLAFAHVVDGDTLWVQLERQVGDSDGRAIIERDYRGGTCIRLHDDELGLNTPEKLVDKVAWNAARTDLLCWTRMTPVAGLVCVTYGKDRGGRTLGNLVPEERSRITAVAYMRERGWEAYKK